MPRILVATLDGLHAFDDRGLPGAIHHAGRAVTAIAANRDQIWAIVEGSEVSRTTDGDRWINVGDIGSYRATCIAATDDDVLVGSSQARLFRVVVRGPEPVVSFDAAEGRSSCYTPWGGPPDNRPVSAW